MSNKLPSNFLTAGVLLHGAPINALYNLVSIGISRAVSSIGSAELVFTLNSGDGTLDAGESNDFAPGSMLEIQAGDDGVNTSLFKGIIVQQRIRLAETAAPEFIVQCSEEAIRMTNSRKNRCFQHQQDSAVISDVVKEYHLSSSVDSTGDNHPQLIQYQSSDWDFILARAAANGLLVYTDGAIVMVRKPGNSESSGMTLVYGTNIYSFDCALDVRAQMASIGILAWSGATPSGVRLSALRGTLKTTGSAAPRLNVPVNLKGFGNRFDGDALVTSIRHEISDGDWYTTLGFGLPAEKDTAPTTLSAPAAGGLLPAVSGLQNGTVKQIDQDPDGEYRIMVEVPVFDPSGVGTWARLAQFYAGAGAGSFFLPEPGDEVILGFLNDDPRYPVILGMMYSKKNQPPYMPDPQNKIKGIVTRNQLSLSFDDDAKVLTIQTPGGNELSLSDQDKSVRLKDQNGNVLLLDHSGITLESMRDLVIKAGGNLVLNANGSISAHAFGDVQLEGLNVEASAKMTLLAQGQASAELKSSGQTTVKGAMVMIN